MYECIYRLYIFILYNIFVLYVFMNIYIFGFIPTVLKFLKSLCYFLSLEEIRGWKKRVRVISSSVQQPLIFVSFLAFMEQ